MRKMQATSLRPSDLLQQPEPDLRLKFDLDEQFATRLTQLISRDIEHELVRLASLGITPLTRADSDYPENIARV